MINTFDNVVLIEKGWSVDRKYRATTADGKDFLLRVSPRERYDGCKKLFSIMKSLEELELPISVAMEIQCNEQEVNTTYSWIEGLDAEAEIPKLTKEKQMNLGIRAGEILNKIHTVNVPYQGEEWSERFLRKTVTKIERYKECGIHLPGADRIISYLIDNKELLKGRPQTFQHGDYHIGNMMLSGGDLIVIDFDRYDFGDPWEEFNRIVWSAQVSPDFATGQIKGYFNGEPPEIFFKLLKYYICSNTLSSIYWAISFGDIEVEKMLKQGEEVLQWYDQMKSLRPIWYKN